MVQINLAIVRRAVAGKRITSRPDGLIDSEQADREWETNPPGRLGGCLEDREKRLAQVGKMVPAFGPWASFINWASQWGAGALRGLQEANMPVETVGDIHLLLCGMVAGYLVKVGAVNEEVMNVVDDLLSVPDWRELPTNPAWQERLREAMGKERH